MAKKKRPATEPPGQRPPRPTPDRPRTAPPGPPPIRATPAPAPRPAQPMPRPVARPATQTPTAAAAPGVNVPIERRPVLWWIPAILTAVGFLLYVNTFHHQYALDDIAAIEQNGFVRKGIAGIPDLLKTEFWHFSNISLGYYRPLSLITFALEQEFFGFNQPGYSHVINAVLYGLIGLVLGVLLQKWLPRQAIMALLIGLVFMAHPIHTEIVANIKGRDEILSFLFISLMLLTYWRYLETKAWAWIVAACASLYMAFLSKESSIVSLALIPAMTYWFARRNVVQSLLTVWPFLIVAALFFWQKKMMIGSLSGNPPVDWANYPYAIEKTQKSTTFKFLLYYLRLLIVPHPLVYDYSYNIIPSGGKGDWMTWAGFVTMLGMLWFTWKGFLQRTLWGFGLFWFFVTMMPGLGFIWIRGGIFAERFAFAAVLGFAFVAVWGLWKLLVKTPEADPIRTDEADTARPLVLKPYVPLLALMAVVMGLYSFKTVTRNVDWENNFVLFNSALPAAENSCQVQRHVANEWIQKGLKDRAVLDTLGPKMAKMTEPQRKKAQASIDSALKMANTHGRWALDHLQKSTQIYQNFGEAYFSMAYVFQKIIPNDDSAKYYYKQTIRAANTYAPAYNNLGVMYQSEGFAHNDKRKLELASYYYNRSMQVNPAYPDGPRNKEGLKKATGIDVQFLPDSILNKY